MSRHPTEAEEGFRIQGGGVLKRKGVSRHQAQIKLEKEVDVVCHRGGSRDLVRKGWEY